MKDTDILRALDEKIEQLTTARDALRKAFAGEAQNAPAPPPPVAAKKAVVAAPANTGMSQAMREHLRRKQKAIWRVRKQKQDEDARKGIVAEPKPMTAEERQAHQREIWRLKKRGQTAAKRAKEAAANKGASTKVAGKKAEEKKPTVPVKPKATPAKPSAKA